MLYFITITTLILVVVYIKEPRIFLALFQKALFPKSKRGAAFVDIAQHFPESILLEKNWKIFRDELQKAQNEHHLPKFHQVDKLNRKISFDAGPAWRTVVLKAYDGWFKSNCKLFPHTYGMLAPMKNISTIMFSVLEPGTVIPPHCGKLNGILRYHLALQVPKEDGCYLVVNDEKYCWKEGEGVLFDDTYVHSVKNNTSDYRVVLFLDIKKRSNVIPAAINNMLLQLIVKSPFFMKGESKGSIHID